MSFMTGQFGSRVGSYDNASPLANDAVTWAHRFRAAGYDVVLAGKMHFCGPDQLHGFRENLSRDIHADLWQEDGAEFIPKGAANWSQKIEGMQTVSLAGRDDDDEADKGKPQQTTGSFHILEQAGPGSTEELEVDDDVEAKSLAYLAEPARHTAPWVLNASFIAPHFPLVSPQEYWDAYSAEDVDMPPPQPMEEQPLAIQRMRHAFGLAADPGEELTRRARAGYYALITWFDDKVGALLDALERNGLKENTVVVYVSDHGEMAGEHGMWRKSNFYEASCRVPLMISTPPSCHRGWPGATRFTEVVSTVDLIATLLDLCSISGEGLPPLDGASLLPLLRRGPGGGALVGWKDEALSEYLAHGVDRPTAMLRRGRYKLMYSLGDPSALFDIEDDPDELCDLLRGGGGGMSGEEAAAVAGALERRLFELWGNPVDIEATVLASQFARRCITAAGTSSAKM